jgi:hypothetical protein
MLTQQNNKFMPWILKKQAETNLLKRRTKMKYRYQIITFLAIVVLSIALTGCATKQKQNYSGFLQDYPPFEKGLEGVDQRYMKEGVDFSKYQKIMMDEVVFFFNQDANYKGIHPEEIKELSEEFHKAFVEVLGDRLTDTPGPNVARMRLAVTDLEASKPVSGTISTVVPVGLAVNLVKRGTTGEYIGIGSASMETEFLDSISNERIAVVVDDAPGGKFDLGKYSAAKSAFKFWAERLRAFLDEGGVVTQ